MTTTLILGANIGDEFFYNDTAEEETVTIPTGLIGQTLSEVQSQLQELGLDPSNIQREQRQLLLNIAIKMEI